MQDTVNVQFVVSQILSTLARSSLTELDQEGEQGAL